MDGDVGYGQAEADLGSSVKEVLNSAGHKVEVRFPNTPAQLGGVLNELGLLLLQLPEFFASTLVDQRPWPTS
jgi:hypothetical protein